MEQPSLPRKLPAWLESEVASAAQTDLPMSQREIWEKFASGVTHAAVEAYLRDQALREAGGESYEAEELFREEAILELADELGIADERAHALWTVAEDKLV